MTSAAPAARGPALAHHLPAALGAAVAVAALLLVPHVAGDQGRLGVVLVLQLGLVWAWVVATGIQSFTGSLTVGAAAAAGADLVLLLPERPGVGGLLAVLGVGFLALVFSQMLRRPRTDLVASLSMGMLLLAAVCALAVLLLVGGSLSGPRPVVVGLAAVGAALVAGSLVDLVVPRPAVADGVPRGVPAVLISMAVGLGVGWFARDGGEPLSGLAPVVLGGVLGTVAALLAVVASFLVVDAGGGGGGGSRRAALAVIQTALPLAAVAPVAHVLLMAL